MKKTKSKKTKVVDSDTKVAFNIPEPLVGVVKGVTKVVIPLIMDTFVQVMKDAYATGVKAAIAKAVEIDKKPTTKKAVKSKKTVKAKKVVKTKKAK